MSDKTTTAPPATDAVTFEIDGRTLTVPKGTLLVEAAKLLDIEIPIFCYEPRLGPPIGACRMCLVEIEGSRGLQTGCSTVATPDMVVYTQTQQVKDAQDGVLELLLANHPLDCPVCDKGGECPLQDRTFEFGPGETRFVEPKRHFPKPLDLSPLVAIDRERCIACYRCVRFSQDVAEDGQLTFQDRGEQTEVATFSGEPYTSNFTGNIIDLCPVGALTSIPYRFVSRPWDIQNAPSVCAHCSVGCNTELTTREGEIKRVTGRPEPNMDVEEGWLCDKGRWAYDTSRSSDRIAEPILRDGVGERSVTIDRAVGSAAAILLRQGIRAAVLVGPKATVEEGFLARRLAETTLRGAPVSRLGIPSAGLGPLREVPSAQLGDLDRADLVVVVGGDPANQQPIVELRLRKARRRGAKIVSVGPRPHSVDALGETMRTAPGALAGGLEGLAERIAAAKHPVVCWDEADLAAEPAAAAALANALSTNAGARQIELGNGANGAGLRAIGLETSGVLDALEAGIVDVLVTIHANPCAGAGSERWTAAAAKAKCVIEIGTHRTALTTRADVVLPALSAYEREGVLVSMNGRAQRLRPAAAGPAGAAPAWELLIALAHRLGTPPRERTPAQVFSTIAASYPAFAGMTYSTLGSLGQPLIATSAPAIPPSAVEPSGEGLALVVTTPIFGGDARRSEALARVRPAPELALHPSVAAANGLATGSMVRVSSPHGSCVLPLRTDERLAETGAYVWLGLGAGTEALLPAGRSSVRVTVAPEATV